MTEQIEVQRDNIVKLLKEKSAMKQDVFKNTISAFDILKKSVLETSIELINKLKDYDKRLIISSSETTNYSIQLKVAGDTLDFFMHTNVFEFEKTHPIFRTGYVKQNQFNSYCGIINVYNFLSDSFKYNRLNDLGYLVCRIFINRENRFFIEAKGPLGAKYATFSDNAIDKDQMLQVINELVIYAISFDLFTPPYETVKEVSVYEMQEKVNSTNLRTGKRLGYGASSNNDDDNNLYI